MPTGFENATTYTPFKEQALKLKLQPQTVKCGRGPTYITFRPHICLYICIDIYVYIRRHDS